MGEIRAPLLQKAISRFTLADPGFYCLALSFQATCAGLMGAAYWLYLRPPDAFMILLAPVLMVVMTHQLRIREDWFWWLLLTTLNIAGGAFLFSVLYQNRYLILIFLFLYTFMNFASYEYRPVGCSVVLLASMSTTLPGGWHHGVNHAIMIFIAFAIVVISCLIFSQVYRSSIRSVLKLLIKQVLNAYSNTMVTPVTKLKDHDNEQAIVANYSAVALKADFLVRKAVFYLPKTKRFQKKAVPVLIGLRRLMADRELIREIRQQPERLMEVIPNTGKVISSISDRLSHTYMALSGRRKKASSKERSLHEDWLCELNAALTSTTSNGSRLNWVLYGLKCILDDLKQLDTAIYLMNDPPSKPQEKTVTNNPLTKRTKLPQEAQTGIYQDAFKAAVAITFAMFFWKATHLPHGYWLLMTTSILLFGGNQGHVLQRAGDRLLGTTLGIVLAYLFVADFLSYNIYWAGTLPAVFFLMFYLYFLTGNYGLMVVFVSIYVGVLLSTFAGSQSEADFFLFGTLFNRFVCTLLAGFLVFICQITIFPRANRSADIMERTFSAFFEDLSFCIDILMNRYMQREEISDPEWVLLNGIIEKYASTEQLRNWMSYEINLDQRYNMLYNSSKDEIERLLAMLRPLVAISLHPRAMPLNPNERESFRMARKMLTDAFKDIEAIFSGGALGKQASASLSDPLQRLFEGSLRERFFVQKLLRFTEALEALMHCALQGNMTSAAPRLEPAHQ